MMLLHHLAPLLLLILAARAEEHLSAHGPFGKAHLSAKFPLPHNCNISIIISPRSTSLTVIDLQVSSTVPSCPEIVLSSETTSYSR